MINNALHAGKYRSISVSPFVGEQVDLESQLVFYCLQGGTMTGEGGGGGEDKREN